MLNDYLVGVCFRRTRGGPSGLIFGLIHLRSPAFIGVRIDVLAQIADVNGLRRTVILTPENRKVGGSTPPLAAATRCAELQTISVSFRPNLRRLHTLLPFFSNE